jgi:4-amino-4-deoxy-L-arabinose transferase-like glycosyltransferase
VLYLLAAPKSIWKRIGHLALALILMLVVSLSWAIAVDLTPASQRPYVGSTQNNSELSLALGYNGLERLLGRGGPGGGAGNGNTPPNPGSPPNAGNGGPPNFQGGGQGQQPQGGPGGGGGLFDIGDAGPLRLFLEPLGEQIGWLLPLALFGIVAVAWQGRPRFQSNRKLQSTILWGMWLLTMGVFFSIAGFFHQYYLTVMAPAIAALVGIGLVTMWQDYRSGGWRGWLLPLALLVTIAEQVYLLSNNAAWGKWMIPLLVGSGVLMVLMLVPGLIMRRFRLAGLSARFLAPAVGTVALMLLIAPTIWGAVPAFWGTEADQLVAGVNITSSDGFGGGRGQNSNTDTALLKYLEARQGTAKYLVATFSSRSADALILATNKPVMTLGGFSGSDPILTTAQLETLAKNGTVRYFLLDGGGFGGGGGRGQQSELTTWIEQHCKLVASSEWQASSSSANAGDNPGGASQLYVYSG